MPLLWTDNAIMVEDFTVCLAATEQQLVILRVS